jgi:hypothetical protein
MAEPMIGKPEKVQMGKLKSPKQTAAPKVMNSAEIITKVLTDEIGPREAKQFLTNVSRLVQAKQAQLVQLGQTVFLLNKIDNQGKPLPPGTVMMFPFTAEPDQAPERIKVLPNTLKQMGFKRLTSMTDDKGDVELAKSMGPNVNVTQKMMFDGQQMSPMYVIEMDL